MQIHNCLGSKIIRNIRKQENVSHNQKKNKPIETEPEMPKMTDESFLEDKDLKIAVINTLHMLKTKEHVKMKSILSEMKDTLNVINRLDAATEKIKNLKVS